MRHQLRKIIDATIYLFSFFIQRKYSHQKKVLIFRKDVLGDFIIFFPTLKYYREFYRSHHLTIVCNIILKDFMPIIQKWSNNIIWFDQTKFRSNFFYRTKFILKLKSEGFDTVIYPVYSREEIGDLIVRITGANEKIGFENPDIKSEWRNKSFTKLIDHNNNIKLEIDRGFYFINTLANTKYLPFLPSIDINEIQLDNWDQIKNTNHLEKGKYCVLFPGAGFSYRIWQIEKWATIADFIEKKKIRVVIAGRKSEKDLSNSITSNVIIKKNITDLTGNTTLNSLCHLLYNSLFYFGSETGALHLSLAIGTPSICVLGGGSFGRFYPYGDKEKNRIIFDKSMKCMGDEWKCAIENPSIKIAPCIANIHVEDGMSEIDFILNYLNDNR